MPRQRKYVLIALGLQLVQVVAGRMWPAVASFAGVLGMGIPLVVGWLYAARVRFSLKEAATGGALIGAVGALVGLIVAALLGSVGWSFIPLGTLASTATGLVGALLGWTVKGRKETAEAAP